MNVVETEEIISAFLHKKEIFCFCRNTNKLTINFNGWDSASVRNRFNALANSYNLPFLIQRKGGRTWITINGPDGGVESLADIDSPLTVTLPKEETSL